VEVHSQQHLRPVVGVCAAIAGIDCENCSRGIVRTIEQSFQLQLLEAFLQSFDFGANFAGCGRVVLRQFHQGCEVSLGGDNLLQRSNQRLERFELAYRLLSRFGFIPEAGLAHLIFDCADFLDFGFVVKDCLASARLVVESVRRGCRVLNPSVV